MTVPSSGKRSVETVVRSPKDLVSPDVEWYCWAADGWDSAGEGSVRDATTTTRGQAAAFFARETTGRLIDVRVWKRYVDRFTRQDVWDGPGKDRWVDRRERDMRDAGEHVPALGELFKLAPDEPPADWQPDEYDAVWRFVPRDYPGAVAVWVCGVKGDNPPERYA